MPVESDQVTFQQVNHMVAGGFALAAQVEDGSDLGEGKTGGLNVPHEVEPVDGLFGIIPVIVGGTIRLEEKPDVLVVADGLGGGAGARGQLSDSHDYEYSPLTFQSPGRCSL